MPQVIEYYKAYDIWDGIPNRRIASFCEGEFL